MPFVGRGGIALALEDVAEVAAAVGADDLGPGHAEGAVLMAGHGAWDAVKISGPAAARLELVVGFVQRRAAAGTGIDTLVRVVLVVSAGARALCALLPEDPELLCPGVMSGGDAPANDGGDTRTWRQDCPPFLVGSLVRVSHAAGCGRGRAKEVAQEGN